MMKWYYQHKGAHVHVRVFSKAALNGTLIFDSDEFAFIVGKQKLEHGDMIEFIPDRLADLKPSHDLARH